MFISGFSYIRNGFFYDYPFIESIKSILPVCDEFVIAIGESNDGTREAIEQIDPQKIKIIDTIWDMEKVKGGQVFAEQANIALDNISGKWAFHIQADEVIHENDLPKIEAAIKKYDDDKKVEGFILPFLHFWGNYEYVRNSRRVHLHEVRIFRNDKLVRSYADSQGFRKYSSKEAYEKKEKGEKLFVKKIDAPVFHYNGVRNADTQKKKMHMFNVLHGDNSPGPQAYAGFDYTQVDRVTKFTKTHPAVMKNKVTAQNIPFNFNAKNAVWRKKDKIMQPIEDILGFKIGEYKNYKLIK